MYKLPAIDIRTGETNNMIIRISDNAYIPIDDNNIDYQEYLKWVEEGNLPFPADPINGE